jgi:hypothetical protein
MTRDTLGKGQSRRAHRLELEGRLARVVRQAQMRLLQHADAQADADALAAAAKGQALQRLRCVVARHHAAVVLRARIGQI